MSGIKGFPSQEKLTGKLGNYDWQQVQTQMEFVTAQKSSSKKIGLDTVQNGVFRINGAANAVTGIPSDQAEQVRVIISASHGASPGDMIRFEQATANPYFEALIISCPDADTLILGSALPVVPVIADQFYILRFSTMRLAADGAAVSSSGPVQIIKDAATVQITKDTATPSNTIALPVEIVAASGTPINITAGDINVQLSDQGANPDATRIGDGTNRLGITASNEAKVSDATLAAAMTTLNAKDFATEVTLAAAKTVLDSTYAVNNDIKTIATAIETKTPALVSGRQPVDGSGVTQPISAASLPLPTGAATSANQTTTNTQIGTVTETVPASDTASSGLNGRLQRIAQRLTSLIALFPATLGQKTMATSFAVTIASDQASLSTLVKGASKVSLVRNDYTSTNVTTGAYVQLIASTPSAANTVEIFDSSGETLVLAIGAAGSEVDQFYINPGGNGQISFLIPSNSRVSIKAVTATASVGYINLNLYS